MSNPADLVISSNELVTTLVVQVCPRTGLECHISCVFSLEAFILASTFNKILKGGRLNRVSIPVARVLRIAPVYKDKLQFYFLLTIYTLD